MKRTPAALPLLCALLCAPLTAPAQREPGKFYRLKRYAAEIPVDETTRPRRNLFTRPELRGPLTALLGARYRRLLRAFYLQTPAEVVNGMNGPRGTAFLVMYGAQKPTEGDDAALVVVDLFDPAGAIYVGFRGAGGAEEWHATRGDAVRDLPPEVRARLVLNE